MGTRNSLALKGFFVIRKNKTSNVQRNYFIIFDTQRLQYFLYTINVTELINIHNYWGYNYEMHAKNEDTFW